MKVHEGNEYELYMGDCLEVMRNLPAQSVDAVICDPPYGVTNCAWDSVIPFTWHIKDGSKVLYEADFLNPNRFHDDRVEMIAIDYWKEHKRPGMWQAIKHVIKPRAAVVLFGSQPFTSALVMSNPQWFKYCWVWDKKLAGNFLNANRTPLMVTEDVAVFGDGQTVYNPQMSKGKGRLKGGNPFRVGGKGSPYGKLKDSAFHFSNLYYPRNILEFTNGNRTNNDNGYHPTQKPVDLLRYLVRTYTNEGDTVLDFTCGSGSTGVACMNEGRKFIGIDNGHCEKDGRYHEWAWVDVAHERIANAAGDYMPSGKDSPNQLSLLWD